MVAADCRLRDTINMHIRQQQAELSVLSPSCFVCKIICLCPKANLVRVQFSLGVSFSSVILQTQHVLRLGALESALPA